jgi:hypothetical protein
MALDTAFKLVDSANIIVSSAFFPAGTHVFLGVTYTMRQNSSEVALGAMTFVKTGADRPSVELHLGRSEYKERELIKCGGRSLRLTCKGFRTTESK